MDKPDYSTIVTEMTFVTPKLAEKLLTLNSHNRSLVNSRVDYYRRLMVGGHWLPNNQGIGISETEVLLDGQHRLWAIVLAPEIDRSFKGVHINITYGLPDEGQMTIDDGLKRKPHDILTLAGSIEETDKVKAMHVSVARQMAGGLKGRSRQLVLIPELEKFLRTHWEAIDFSVRIFPTNIKGVSTAGVRAVLARAYYHAPLEQIKEFAEVLYTGFMSKDIHKGAICLKNWLLSNSFHNNSDKYSRQIYGRTENTLKSFLDGTVRERLAIESSKELFPLPQEEDKPLRTIPQAKVIKKAIANKPDIEVESNPAAMSGSKVKESIKKFLQIHE